MINQRYITLEELMKQVNGELLVSFSLHLQSMIGYVRDFEAGDDVQQVASVPEFLAFYTKIEILCHDLELNTSEKAVKRVISILSQGEGGQPIVGEQFKALGKQAEILRQVFKDEIESLTYFAIKPNKQSLLIGKNLFGKEVASAFPSASRDIEEAGRCLAFERWTASVFHSMRVLEIGLCILAENVGITGTDYKTWGPLIQEIEANVKKASGGDKTKEKFYSEAALQFLYFKDAWRNHVMHVRDTYDEERAETIFGHVQEFMVHLATKLKLKELPF